jgi:RNA polymerase sigma factor (sigma-70 family)
MEACLQLYDRYFDDLYRYVLFRVGNHYDTEDLVSDIFRKVMEHMNKQGVIPEHERAWLFTIAHHRVIDHYRKKKEQVYGTDPEAAGMVTEHIPELFQAASIKNDCLQEALQELQQEDRQMVQLKYMMGFAYREMSTVLGQTEERLRNRVHRIRKKMAGDIAVCMEEGV